MRRFLAVLSRHVLSVAMIALLLVGALGATTASAPRSDIGATDNYINGIHCGCIAWTNPAGQLLLRAFPPAGYGQ